MKTTFKFITAILSVSLFQFNLTAQSLSWFKTNTQTASVFNNVYFADNNTGWAFGDSVNGLTFVKGIIKKSTNQGGLWISQNMGSNAIQISSSYAFNTSSIIAVGKFKTSGNGAVIRSVDGGNTWLRDTTSVPQQIYDVSFVSQSTGWIAGKNGFIGKSVDGGVTWATQATTVTVPLNSVAFADANNGWVVGVASGPGGTILHTNNGGTTYSTQTDPSPGDLLGVAAINASRAVAVGQGGKIILTTNGGNTWTAKTSGTSQDLLDVSFPTPANGWAVGTGGVMVISSDSGKTWSPQVSGVASNINSIQMKSTTLGWYAGDAGNVYFYGTSPAAVKENAKQAKRVRVYPNPVLESATFSLNDNSGNEWNIKITDLLGRIVFEKNGVQSNDFVWKTDANEPGVYIYSIITSSNAVINGKFIIQ